MRAGYQESGYSGAVMHPSMNDGRGYNNDPYHARPQGYNIPPGMHPAAHPRPQYDAAYHSMPDPAHRPPYAGPPHDYPRADLDFPGLLGGRPVYPDERTYPSPTIPYERQPAHYLHKHPPSRDYPVHAAPTRDYPEQVDRYGRPYAAAPFDSHYPDSRGPPVPYPAQGQMPQPCRPPFHNPNSLGYPPQHGYASNGYDRAPPTPSFGPPPDARAMGAYDSYANVRGESWNQQQENLQGAPMRKEVSPIDNFIDRRPRERIVSPDADPRVPEVLSSLDDDASSLEEPEQHYDDRYEDDDTIATQDALETGIDFLNLDGSKRFGVNLDFSQLETVGEDETEPECTPDRMRSTQNPMDPRCWFVLPPPNGISILKGTRLARNSPIENRVTFWQCDVTKVGEADYMYGVPVEVIWWTKAELNNRVIEDDKDRLTNPVAMVYDQECTKAFEKLTERVKKALDRKRHPKPDIEALWNDVKLAKLIKQPILTGLSFGYRGIELGGMGGRRLRAHCHVGMIKEYTDESNYRTKRRARTARRGDAMGLASEEYTLTIRLWARAIAMADQAGAHVVHVLDAREQRVRKQVAREQFEI